MCALLSLIMTHGNVPSEFKTRVITPVVTNYRKSFLNVDKNRPVKIILMLSKIFEMYIYRRIHGLLNLDGLQLGFVTEVGCDKSLFTVSNVVNYCLKRYSDIHSVTLGATAAFDKVNTYRLLTKLIDRIIPFDVLLS